MSHVKKHKEIRDFCPPRNKLRVGSRGKALGWPTVEGPSPPTTFQRWMRRSAPPVARRLLLGPKQTALTSDKWASCGKRGGWWPRSLLYMPFCACSQALSRVPVHVSSHHLCLDPCGSLPSMLPHIPLPASWFATSSSFQSITPHKMLRGSCHKLWKENLFPLRNLTLLP